MYYFAYGSNMNWEQMQRRCPSAKFICVAQLRDYRFAIARHSRLRKCGTSNVLAENGCVVWGIVYDIDEHDLEILDDFEDGYRKEKVFVYAQDDGQHPPDRGPPEPPAAETRARPTSGERRGLSVAIAVIALGPVIRVVWALLLRSLDQRNMIAEVFPTVADSLATGCALTLLGPRLSANERYLRWLRSPLSSRGSWTACSCTR